MTRKRIFGKALRDTIPVMTGYLVLGAGFGMILRAEALPALMAPVMSLLIYAGSMQFVAADLLAEGASLAVLALTTVLVNARHIFYGISMVEPYRDTGAAKPYLVFGLTDETFSLAAAEGPAVPERDRKRYYLLVTLLNQCYWVAGSAFGALAGGVLRINTEGMDFALTAMFITIFLNHWMSGKGHRAALTGVLITALCLIIFGRDSFLIPSMAVITGLLLLAERREARRE